MSEKMGMTIDDALKEVNRVILCLTDGGNVTKEVLALEKLVDITHKYQKIQKIINNTDYIQEDVIRYKMICEVIKDET